MGASLPLLENVDRVDDRYERCASGEPLHDYILERYDPRVEPEGKLRSVNLLYESFIAAGVEATGRKLVDAVRTALGPFRTVWGVKHDATGTLRGWELYFYDWYRVHPDLSVAHLREMLAPFVRLEAQLPSHVRWHMLSVDMGLDALRTAELGSTPAEASVHAYVDMRSYALRGTSMTFQNVYTFHDPRAEVDDILARLRASLYVDLDTHPLHVLIPPELFECHRICVANKRDGDALYFSRVSTPALARFLRDHGYPSPLRDLVVRESAALEHLRWDVGIDFTASPEGPRIRRSGFYGSF